MKVMVVGKENISGTSRKTGKAFNNNIVHLTYKKNGVIGEACESVWLDPDTYPLDSIHVGKVHDIDRDSRGFVCGFGLA
jgi:hypothetical protein